MKSIKMDEYKVVQVGVSTPKSDVYVAAQRVAREPQLRRWYLDSPGTSEGRVFGRKALSGRKSGDAKALSQGHGSMRKIGWLQDKLRDGCGA